MLIRFIILIAFLLNCIGPMPAYAQSLNLPKPGVMVHLSPPMNPAILKGLKVHPDNPFKFDFILDQGDESGAGHHFSHFSKSSAPHHFLKEEANRLIKYFLASLTTPEKDLWVNLSPYEKDRIIPNSFGLTEMGRDLLGQDYMLKQITASLIYPEDEIGKKFWKRVYEEAARKYNTTNIPVNTFNKVWIVPEKAVVYENAQAGTAYVVESRLKVMLEEDYLSFEKHANVGVAEGGASPATGRKEDDGDTRGQDPNINKLGSQIICEIVIPELTKEINEGANFAQLRQVYNSLILATWYKKKIKDSILSQVYADKNKTAGIDTNDPQAKEKIYQQYLQAFKKGVYNYIKEEQDPITQQTTPRKYFSGGFDAALIGPVIDYAQASQVPLSLDGAQIVTADLKEQENRVWQADNIHRLFDLEMVNHLPINLELTNNNGPPVTITISNTIKFPLNGRIKYDIDITAEGESLGSIGLDVFHKDKQRIFEITLFKPLGDFNDLVNLTMRKQGVASTVLNFLTWVAQENNVLIQNSGTSTYSVMRLYRRYFADQIFRKDGSLVNFNDIQDQFFDEKIAGSLQVSLPGSNDANIEMDVQSVQGQPNRYKISFIHSVNGKDRSFPKLVTINEAGDIWDLERDIKIAQVVFIQSTRIKGIPRPLQIPQFRILDPKQQSDHYDRAMIYPSRINEIIARIKSHHLEDPSMWKGRNEVEQREFERIAGLEDEELEGVFKRLLSRPITRGPGYKPMPVFQDFDIAPVEGALSQFSEQLDQRGEGYWDHIFRNFISQLAVIDNWKGDLPINQDVDINELQREYLQAKAFLSTFFKKALQAHGETPKDSAMNARPYEVDEKALVENQKYAVLPKDIQLPDEINLEDPEGRYYLKLTTIPIVQQINLGYTPGVTYQYYDRRDLFKKRPIGRLNVAWDENTYSWRPTYGGHEIFDKNKTGHDHRGKGLGRLAYQKLIKIFGVMASSGTTVNLTSVDAQKMWKALGASIESLGADGIINDTTGMAYVLRNPTDQAMNVKELGSIVAIALISFVAACAHINTTTPLFKPLPAANGSQVLQTALFNFVQSWAEYTSVAGAGKSEQKQLAIDHLKESASQVSVEFGVMVNQAIELSERMISTQEISEESKQQASQMFDFVDQVNQHLVPAGAMLYAGQFFISDGKVRELTLPDGNRAVIFPIRHTTKPGSVLDRFIKGSDHYRIIFDGIDFENGTAKFTLIGPDGHKTSLTGTKKDSSAEPVVYGNNAYDDFVIKDKQGNEIYFAAYALSSNSWDLGKFNGFLYAASMLGRVNELGVVNTGAELSLPAYRQKIENQFREELTKKLEEYLSLTEAEDMESLSDFLNRIAQERNPFEIGIINSAGFFGPWMYEVTIFRPADLKMDGVNVDLILSKLAGQRSILIQEKNENKFYFVRAPNTALLEEDIRNASLELSSEERNKLIHALKVIYLAQQKEKVGKALQVIVDRAQLGAEDQVIAAGNFQLDVINPQVALHFKNKLRNSITIDGEIFEVKKEFHITLALPHITQQIIAALKQTERYQHLESAEIENLTKKIFMESAQGISFSAALSKNPYKLLVRRDAQGNIQKKSVIALLEVSGQEKFYRNLNKRLKEEGVKDFDIIRDTDGIPFHVTLFAHGDPRGIGLKFKGDFEAIGQDVPDDIRKEIEEMVEGDRAMRSFIKGSETVLSHISLQIGKLLKDQKQVIVLIDGDPASGKSSLAELVERMKIEGLKYQDIQIFNIDFGQIPKDAFVKFQSKKVLIFVAPNILNFFQKQSWKYHFSILVRASRENLINRIAGRMMGDWPDRLLQKERYLLQAGNELSRLDLSFDPKQYDLVINSDNGWEIASDISQADSENKDKAMKTDTGGIDFTANKTPLEVQNSGQDIKFHMDPAILQQLHNASGFVPVIINIQPMTDLRQFLGITEKVLEEVSV